MRCSPLTTLTIGLARPGESCELPSCKRRPRPDGEPELDGRTGRRQRAHPARPGGGGPGWPGQQGTRGAARCRARGRYAQGVKQLKEQDWIGAEATFRALLDRRASYRDVRELFALARRQGSPEEKHEHPPKPPANKPEPASSELPREDVGATSNPKTSVAAGPPRLVIHQVEDVQGEVGRFAKPTVQRREKFDPPVVRVISIAVAAVLLIIIVAGVFGRDGAGSTEAGSIVTPTIIERRTPSPSATAPPAHAPSLPAVWSSMTPAQKRLFAQTRFTDCKPLSVTDSALKTELVGAIRCDPTRRVFSTSCSTRLKAQ